MWRVSPSKANFIFSNNFSNSEHQLTPSIVQKPTPTKPLQQNRSHTPTIRSKPHPAPTRSSAHVVRRPLVRTRVSYNITTTTTTDTMATVDRRSVATVPQHMLDLNMLNTHHSHPPSPACPPPIPPHSAQHWSIFAHNTHKRKCGKYNKRGETSSGSGSSGGGC